MNIEYNVETLDECLEEMKPLLLSHYEEVAMYQDKVKFNPDYDKYYALEAAEALHIVTVREGNTLIGYFVSLIMPHMHYKDNNYAVNDILYIHEDYRKSKVGLDMFLFAEECLKVQGVDVLCIHMKTAIPFDSLCEGLGYDYAERNYTKYIGD